MIDVRHERQRSLLWTQLWWFVRLRWVAATAVVLGAAVDRQVLQRYDHAGWTMLLGGGIFLYNLVLLLVLRRISAAPTHRTRQVVLAWVQILLDLGCLTLLTLWTGGLRSPLLGFFVFHMVFASLLLPRFMAMAGASVAVLMLLAGLRLDGRWPQETDAWLVFAGWALTLLFTVVLTNRITHALRRQRRRLIRQNRHIRLMTRRLRQQQQSLIQQEKMVALGQMAAGVAHEVANPLASMDSLLQLVQRRPERLNTETLATLRQQVERVNQIVRQMTTFAHPADGQWQVVDVNSVVDGALAMVTFDHRLRRVQLVRELGEAVGQARLMPQAMQQVLVNLILNALDAMSDVAQPRLTVRTTRAEQQCVIEVTDNGQGIRPEHMDRLFEPFFTTKPVGKGTGLGLSISYSLLQKQGGSIEVRSQVGQGTTFAIRLPLLGQTAVPAARVGAVTQQA